MASEPFNAVGGITVGIPPISVVGSNGNVTTNINAPNANVRANTIYANNYLYANGSPIATLAGGSNTQLQFNNNGAFGGIPNVTWNGSNLSLGNVATIKIGGGINGYVLQTDGAGNLSWTAQTGNGGSNAAPAGSNTQVQFNDAGSFGGDAGFTYDNVTNLLTVTGINAGNITANYIVTNWDVTANVVYSNYLYGDGSNITNVHAVLADVANEVAGSNVTGQVNFAAVANSIAGANVTGQVSYAGIANSVNGSNVSGQVGNAIVAGTVYTAAQPNITSLGTLTSLSVTGNVTAGNIRANTQLVSFVANGTAPFLVTSTTTVANLNVENANTAETVTLSAQPNITSVGTLSSLTVSANIGAGNINLSNTVSAGNLSVTNNSNLNGTTTIGSNGSIKINGTANYALSPNVNLGNVENVHIQGGVNGYVLSTDGAGNLTWQAGGGGGNGTPGGSNTQIQYNDNGAFNGSAFFTFNEATNNVTIGGNLIANTITLGSGIYEFSHTNVYFATTVSASANQVILSIDAEDVAEIDYHIISTDTVGNIRQISKINSIVLGSTVHYNEYSTLAINGYTGDFTVGYDPGNMIVQPSVVLYMSPQTANSMSHKLQVTVYRV